MMGFEVILLVIFWVAAIALAMWVIPGFRAESTSGGNPVDIARERYARGEISREQLQQITDDLRRAA